MLKYKKGDKVKVRPDLKEGECGCDTVVEAMLDYRGKVTSVVEINDITHDKYKLDGCGGWWFTDEMLMPATPTIQEIKDKKMSCVVHTKTKEEAKMLVEYMPIGDWGTHPVELWDKHGHQTGYRIEDGELRQYADIAFYKDVYPRYGEIYEFSDITASGGVVDTENTLTATVLKAKADELTRKLYSQLSCSSIGFVPLKTRTKEDNHMTFTTTKGERYTSLGKHKGKTIPTITTTVNINGRTGSATCDEADYNERDGILNAIANAYCYGNFDKEYRKAVKEQEKQKKLACTCGFCGKVLESPEAKAAHEAWHVERKKAKHERYLIRKEARRRLTEAEREGKIEQVMKELYKK